MASEGRGFALPQNFMSGESQLFQDEQIRPALVQNFQYITWFLNTYVPQLSDGQWDFGSFPIEGDIISSNWDGSIPADLSTVDPTATAGFYIDSSVGSLQLMADLFIGNSTSTGNQVFLSSEVQHLNLQDVNNNWPDSVFILDYTGGYGRLFHTTDGASTFSSGLWIHEDGEVSVRETDAQFVVQDGDVNAPGIARLNSKSDGIYFSAGVMHFGLGGAEKFRAASEGFQAIDGSATAPSISFINDINLGLYRVTTDVLGFAAAGALVGKVDSNGDWYLGSGGTGKSLIANAAGTAAFPTYSFEGDQNTGIIRSAADALGFVTGGTERVTLTTSALDLNGLTLTDIADPTDGAGVGDRTYNDARYAASADGVTNGDSHNHSGGDGAQIDHGALGGLGDNDHSQYLLRNGGTMTSHLDPASDVSYDLGDAATSWRRIYVDHVYGPGGTDSIDVAENTLLGTWSVGGTLNLNSSAVIEWGNGGDQLRFDDTNNIFTFEADNTDFITLVQNNGYTESLRIHTAQGDNHVVWTNNPYTNGTGDYTAYWDNDIDGTNTGWAITTTLSSGRAIKKNIRDYDVDSVGAAFLRIPMKSWEYDLEATLEEFSGSLNGEMPKDDDGPTRHWYVAEDVEAELPWLVGQPKGDSVKRIRDGRPLQVAMIAGMHHMKSEIDSLKAEVEELKNTISLICEDYNGN